MDGAELLDAGFKKYPQVRAITSAEVLYQLRVRDEFGTRYFIDVDEFQNPTGSVYEGEISYNDGCKWCPCTVRILLYSTIDTWTPQQLIDAAAEFWRRLQPEYYEAGE